MVRKVIKSLLIALGALVALVVLVFVALYIPPVQDFAVRFATEKVAESTGMHISAEKLRLKFPLRLNVSRLCIIQENGDTMLTAASADTKVKLMPLLKSRIEIEGFSLDSAFYQMGNRDSVMWLRAFIDRADIGTTDFGLKSGHINLSHTVIDGADISMRMLEDTVSKTPVDTASVPYIIKSKEILLKRITYRMSMEGLIDSLGCYVGDARLSDALIDLPNSVIHGKSLSIDSVDAAYLYPAPTENSDLEKAPVAEDTTSTTPFTITADTLRLTAKSGLYAQSGVSPVNGFDPAYISVKDVDIEIDNFYNRQVSIKVPVKKLRAIERCGVELSANGLFEMDSISMRASDFEIRTLYSQLFFNASMGMGDLSTDPTVPISLKANGAVDPADIALAFPDMAAMLKPFTPLALTADIEGSPERLDIYDFNVAMDKVLRLKAEGQASNIMDPDKMGVDLGLTGWLNTLSDKQFSFLPIPSVPEMTLRGDVSYVPGKAQGGLSVRTRGGQLTADANWTARSEGYDATVQLDRFPVDAFMADLGVGDVTGKFRVNGHGYDPLS
ncbi:MAG: hypothetical protein K2K55_10835, partial [Duncaniella sp.]|nr:hypothetical protein [Duncaniella sp.]